MADLTAMWRGFSAKAKAIERQSPFAPSSLPVYAITVPALLAELIWFWAARMTYSPSPWLHLFYLLIWIALTAPIARAYGFGRLALYLDALALPGIFGAITATGVSLLCLVSGPPVDATLANADRALGFDWLALFHFYQRNPWIVELSNHAYRSMIPQNFAVPLLLAATQQDQRFWTLLTAWCVASVVTALLFPFFPAATAIPHYGIKPDDLPALNILWPWNVEPLISGLRQGSITDLAQVQIGLVTFPSFHACLAVIFAWSMWRTPIVRYPATLLNLAMVLSVPIRGSHYFVDVLGGVALAGASIWISKRMVRS